MPKISDQPVRVWDLPTRLFHWLLALAVVGAVVTAQMGGNAMAWHFFLGYSMFVLLAFRLLWGVVGGRWSRFASFIYAPATVLRYLRGQQHVGEHLDVGHNPTASFSVFAMLGFLMLQVATGLVADDDIGDVGPLNKLVSAELASQSGRWHTELGQWLIIALVGLHVVAIVYYLLRKRINLMRPMLSGNKMLPIGTPASADALPQRLLAALLLAACAVIVTWVVNL